MVLLVMELDVYEALLQPDTVGVSTQLITSLLLRAALEYVALLVPTLLPLSFH